MGRTRKLSSKAAWITSGLVLVALAAALWPGPSAEAQLGGYSQVTRLELRSKPAEGAFDARFHLASGVAVDQRIEGDHEIDRLLQAATALAAGKARLFASVEADRVKAWTLSVP